MYTGGQENKRPESSEGCRLCGCNTETAAQMGTHFHSRLASDSLLGSSGKEKRLTSLCIVKPKCVNISEQTFITFRIDVTVNGYSTGVKRSSNNSSSAPSSSSLEMYEKGRSLCNFPRRRSVLRHYWQDDRKDSQTVTTYKSYPQSSVLREVEKTK